MEIALPFHIRDFTLIFLFSGIEIALPINNRDLANFPEMEIKKYFRHFSFLVEIGSYISKRGPGDM